MSQGPLAPFRLVPGPGIKVAVGLNCDEILPLPLCEEVVGAAESGQPVKAVSVVDEGPILMKSLRTFSMGMINGQVLAEISYTLKNAL